MTDLNKAVPGALRELLDNSGIPWWIEPGSSHNKVRLAGRLVAILPRGRNAKIDNGSRAEKNSIANVKRAIRAFETGEDLPLNRRGG